MIHTSLYCNCKYEDCEREGPKKNIDKLLKALCQFEKTLGEIGKISFKLIANKAKIDYHLIITSGYRCKRHNAKVGGVKNSRHRFGMAADIKVRGMSTEALFKQAKMSGLFNGIGIYNTFVHVDIRDKVGRWDKRNARRKELLPLKLR
jgi:uncharacterized protein YcbK (DUF882 family)